MGWEYRGGRRYYYRKRRQGKQVISEYIGGGLAGLLASSYDASDHWEREQQRAELREYKATAAKLNEQISQVEKYSKAITRAVLLLSGYHAPKRQWRKVRQ